MFHKYLFTSLRFYDDFGSQSQQQKGRISLFSIHFLKEQNNSYKNLFHYLLQKYRAKRKRESEKQEKCVQPE